VIRVLPVHNKIFDLTDNKNRGTPLTLREQT
jgi:hypothetical protein